MNTNAIVAAIAARSAAKEEPGDYRQDGLLYCGHCRTPKQCRLKIGEHTRVVGCMCACQTREYEALREAERDRQERIRLRQLRAECVQDRQLELCVFAAAQENENIRRCRAYVDRWPEMLAANAGLMFYGDTGGGKTFAAACIANADSFIRRLPRGYDTLVTADGANLSQGQRQLLAIARAAVADPPVLILDEATSSIDTRTEALIEKGMDQLMEGRTVFVIAHRLSTVRNADAIMVLEHGKIVERGSHDELLEQQGVYYQLYNGMFELS